MKLLIDGDVVRYRCGFAAQKTRYVVKGPLDFEQHFENAKEANAWMKLPQHADLGLTREAYQEVEPVENALHSVKKMMQSMQDKWPDADLVVYFSCRTPDNWRTQFYPQYKANRPDRRPEHDKAIRDYMLKKYVVILGEAAGLEADDLISYAAHECREKQEDYIICSIDKDLKQISGPFYDFVKDELEDISRTNADSLLEHQKITGDSVDNIPGLSGWGKAKATKYLAIPGNDAWKCYQEFYDNVDIAWYHYCLNQALVTLPWSEYQLRWLGREVENAWEEVKAIQSLSEDAERDLAGTGTGEGDTPEVKAPC